MGYLKFTPSWLRLLIVILLVLGVFFRLFHLDYKVYWHDEVYTSMRAASFTRQEIDQEIFQNRIIPASELEKYQRPKLGSTFKDTIKSLEIEDPQHPPLYFLMARFWMQIFGSSLTASRILPALLSFLNLPLMYSLGLELFGSRTVALFAMVLLALSPFDILFAQTARQYGLLTTTVIGSNFLLLKAWRLPTWQNWGLYTLANTVGWYTHPLFGLTVIAQGVYVLLEQILGWKFSKNKLESAENLPIKKGKLRVGNINFFVAAIAISLVLYYPWIIVLKNNYQRLSDTTSWNRISADFLYLIKLWILSFTSLFFDLDFGFDNIWNYLPRLLVILVIAAAIYKVCKQTNRANWLFIITTIFVPFLMLALPDLLVGGKRSTVSRYLISCYPGVQLAVAYLLAKTIINKRRFWQSITLLLITGSVASSTVSAFADTWWSKDLSFWNAEIVRQVNAAVSPIIISDIGDDYTNTGDLISLSYFLHDNVRLLLVSQPPELEKLNITSLLAENSQLFLFRPSSKLIEAFEKEQSQLVQVFKPGRLWQIK